MHGLDRALSDRNVATVREGVRMKLTRPIVIGVTCIVAAVVFAAPAGAAAPVGGGCAAFGLNVADLATTLGAAFGATASAVATSAPAAFPKGVVGPEQAALCG